MATRLLLTLLALLTGLSAQLTPAQARIRADGASAVGVVTAATRSERAAAVLPHAARPADGRQLQRRCAVAVLRDQVYCAPTVLPGIDRARE